MPRRGRNVPCNLVLIKSRGCSDRVDTIPAVNPATASTKDDEKPWLVMNATLHKELVVQSIKYVCEERGREKKTGEGDRSVWGKEKRSISDWTCVSSNKTYKSFWDKLHPSYFVLIPLFCYFWVSSLLDSLLPCEIPQRPSGSYKKTRLQFNNLVPK